MQVVVVESPAKAKTINKYLGAGYKVLASFGHIRDLPSKDGSVEPENEFNMSWHVDSKAEKHVKEILAAVKNADSLILATDPDREGEAISWHIQQVLMEKKALTGKHVSRVAFNEITKKSILEAFSNPRPLDTALVEAYLARRALDYLVGFNLSPVLWRKLPGAKSAGRVQSVALRLICEREAEIEIFIPQEYWSIEANLKTDKNEDVLAKLTHLKGEKLNKFSLGNETDALAAKLHLEKQQFHVTKIERKQTRRHPYPPFITSTLQQEASRKLGFSATHTMRVAQKLYEGIDIKGETVGLITYMRTDGVQLSQDAIQSARKLVSEQFGPAYIPEKPRIYKSRAKNAQEAHEAIRPTDLQRHPDKVRAALDRDQHRLYELIWKRTMACQMASAVYDQVAVTLASADGQDILRAVGSVMVFDGFMTLYQESVDDSADEDEKNRKLPLMHEGDTLKRDKIDANQHFTSPPPRYGEASLVKKLEELGIGRPSTYASILQVLRDRDYVRLENKRFIANDRGRLVTTFLSHYFNRYVQYDFTANLENQLDEISDGQANWKQVLSQFWQAFSAAISETKELTITDVIDTLDQDLSHFFFPNEEGAETDPRICKACDGGKLSLKLGRYGAFIGCSNYPECRYTRPLGGEDSETSEEAQEVAQGPKVLGLDPETETEITLRKGPYGFYVQLGEAEKKSKPKRSSLFKGMSPTEVDLALALKLLSLPREVGLHPETGKMIKAGMGRFGPYLLHESKYSSLPADDNLLEIGLNRAVVVIAEAAEKKGKGGASAGTELGKHPEDEAPVMIHSGRYGPYVKHGSLLASLPKEEDPATFTLAQAVKLIAEKGKPSGRKKATAAKKKTASDSTAKTKKAPAKKATPTKAAPKKETAGKVTKTSTAKPAKDNGPITKTGTNYNPNALEDSETPPF